MSPFPFNEWFSRNSGRFSKTVLTVGIVVGVVSAVLASRLELRTSFSELLPSGDPGVVALETVEKRMGDLALLLVGIRSPDREANLRYAEKLTLRLRALPPEICQLAAYHIKDIKSFLERNKWLYITEGELSELRDRLKSEISKRKNPLFLDLADEEPLAELKARISAQNRVDDRFPNGVFTNENGSYVWVAALPPGGLFGERSGEALFQKANALIKEINPADFHPKMAVHVAGPVATLVANRQAIEMDILWVTLMCVSIVALSIGIYFRRLRAIPLVGIAGAIGTLVAFAAADLAFGYLNSSTAFLGSIILGNGINYAIILMSRYEELRATGHDSQTALPMAMSGVFRGTAVAAVCASVCYASLMLTSFRGFYQFGVMGAIGVIACWISTFTVLPAFLHVLDARRRKADVPRRPFELGWLGRGVGRRPGWFLLASTALTVAAVPGLNHFLHNPFEYDFRKLNTRLSHNQEVQAFSENLDSLFGRWPSPTSIVLADRIEEVESIRKAIRKQDAAEPNKPSGRNWIGDVLTVYDLLPGPPEVQTRKLAILADIRKLLKDPALELLTDDERKQLTAVDPPPGLQVLEPKDLPPLARRPFTEVDGTIGRVVLVYAGGGFSIWNGENLLHIAKVLQHLHLEKEGKTLDTSGSAVVFAAMIRSVLHDGPLATALALGLVMLLALVIMRPLRSGLVTILALSIGIIWMVGAAGHAEVKVTFLNFIALPITFGIGVEYALNVIARYQQSKDMPQAVASTGGAVALCSWTTIVGYGSLLAARNQALQGFGAMAVLGEIACLSAALIALPSFILWLQQRRSRAAGGMPETSSLLDHANSRAKLGTGTHGEATRDREGTGHQDQGQT